MSVVATFQVQFRRFLDPAGRVVEPLPPFAADPQNGNIQDSLGWAQYRQGDYQAAVDTLEQAIDKEPANAEINDHLG
ncbi:tetratricopeptide repeat protein, partial [Pelomicrobium sp.]|uniref:tetratricopeptide repeat protein n=1 Tax=Pelomicrobium sp. TaxID=2815319 RepID=UPI002FDCB6A4